MTKADLITEIGNHPSVLSVLDPNPTANESIGNVNIYEVPILYLLEPNMTQKGVQVIAVVNEGDTGNEAAYYHTSKRVDFAHRSPHVSETQYKNGIEAQFAGWTVLDININIQGEFDFLTVRADNGTNAITRRIMTWRDDADSLQWQLVEGQSA